MMHLRCVAAAAVALAALLIADRAVAQSDAVVEGQVVELGTRKPLPGLPVLLPALATETTTGDDGRFRLTVAANRARGMVRLEIPAFDHEAAVRRVVLPASGLVFRLKPLPAARFGSVVEAPTADAARVAVSAETARLVPGNSGDPVKVVEALPGVARTGGPATGQLVVRGSAPGDTRFDVDGLPVQQLYHFGGLYSVLQDGWIGDVRYRPGGFSAEFGNAIGGWLGLTLAPLAADGVHGNVDINTYHAAAMVTAPVSTTWTVGAGARRSYFDAWVPAVLGKAAKFTAAPRYVDYQLRADGRPAPGLTVRLLAFGSDDELQLVTAAPSDADPATQGFGLRRYFHQIQATANWQLGPKSSLYLGLGTSYQKLKLSPSATTRFDLTFDPVTARALWTQVLGRDLTLRVGGWATAQRFAVDARLPLPTKEGQVPLPLSAAPVLSSRETGLGGDGALHADGRWQPATWFDVTAGVRAGWWSLARGTWAADPRLTVRINPVPETAVTLSAGLYHQAPQPDTTSEAFGNPNLGLEASEQYSLGVQQRLGGQAQLEVTGFAKRFNGLVVPGSFGGPRYDNLGSGLVRGAELLVRGSAGPVDGWVSYTLSRATRIDRPGQPERPFAFDQTHVLAVVAGCDLGSGWRAGLRLRAASGNPYTPLQAAYFDASADVTVPAAATAPLAARLPAFVQLDARIDKTWTFDLWRLTAYLEGSNLTNRANVEAIGYNHDYSQRRDVVGLPVLAGFGVRGSF